MTSTGHLTTIISAPICWYQIHIEGRALHITHIVPFHHDNVELSIIVPFLKKKKEIKKLPVVTLVRMETRSPVDVPLPLITKHCNPDKQLSL